ncbi:MAG: MazG nucleotide pyrophosphohydrolase domain-containing protein, partial [Ilumatobacteraceae bacterium]
LLHLLELPRPRRSLGLHRDHPRLEHVGELAQAVRKGSHEQRVHEFGDVIAWVATLANQMGVDLTQAIERYATGCPRCAAMPCACA